MYPTSLHLLKKCKKFVLSAVATASGLDGRNLILVWLDLGAAIGGAGGTTAYGQIG